MAKKNSLRDEIDELKETLAEIKDATVDKDGKRSMPAGSLQRGVEGLATRAGSQDSGAAWSLAKDVGRAFIPARLEALARSKFRGEDYEDAKSKAEESRETLENERSGLSAAGAMVQGAVGTAASIALYAKLSAGGAGAASAPAPAAAVAAPVAAAPKGNLKAMSKLGLVAAIGAAAGSYLMAQRSQPGQTTNAPAPAPKPAPAIAAAATVKAKSAAPAAPVKPAAAPAKPVKHVPARPAQRQQPQRSGQQRKAAAAQQKQRVGSYERTYKTGKKAGITETVFLNG